MFLRWSHAHNTFIFRNLCSCLFFWLQKRPNTVFPGWGKSKKSWDGLLWEGKAPAAGQTANEASNMTQNGTGFPDIYTCLIIFRNAHTHLFDEKKISSPLKSMFFV